MFSVVELFLRVGALFLGVVSIALIAYGGYSTNWAIGKEMGMDDIYYNTWWGPFQMCYNNPFYFDVATPALSAINCLVFSIKDTPHGVWTAIMILIIVMGICVLIATFSTLLSVCCPSDKSDKSNIGITFFAIFLNVVIVVLFPVTWGTAEYCQNGICRMVCPGSSGAFNLGQCEIGTGFISQCCIFVPLVGIVACTAMAKNEATKKHLQKSKKNLNKASRQQFKGYNSQDGI